MSFFRSASHWIYNSLVGVLILFSVIFYATHMNQLRIDTHLNDLMPATSVEQAWQAVAAILSEDISQRASLLIVGSDEDNVRLATSALEAELSAHIHLTVRDTEKEHEQILALYQEHPFLFLTEERRRLLENAQLQKRLQDRSQEIELKDDVHHKIQQQALRRLYRGMDAAPSLFSFEDDPLGYLSEYVNTAINSLVKQAPTTRVSSSSLSQRPSNEYSQQLNLSVAAEAFDRAHQKVLADLLAQAIQFVEAQYAVEVLQSGVFFFALEAAISAEKQVKLISSLSSISILLLLWFTFRSIRPLILAFVSIAFGIAVAVALTHAVFGSLHILTIVFGASLIGIVVDYTIHYCYHLTDSESTTHGHHPSLNRALLLSLLTSLVGYGSLAAGDVIALDKIALFSCVGTASAWLMIKALGWRTVRHIRLYGQLPLSLLLRLGQYLPRQQSYRLCLMGAVAIIGVLIIQMNWRTDDSPRSFFNVSKKMEQSQQAFSKRAMSFEPGIYMLVEGETIQATFENMQTTSASLEKAGIQASDLFSLRNWMPSPKEQVDHFRLQQELYGPEGIVKGLYQALQIPSTEASPLIEQYQQQANHMTNALVVTPEQVLNTMPSLPPLWFHINERYYGVMLITQSIEYRGKASSLVDHLRSIVYPLAHTAVIDTVANAEQALTVQRLKATTYLSVAYVLVALLLLLYYRTWRPLGLLLIPAIASIVAVAGTLLIGQSLNLFHLMALFLLLGLGMDYVIFAYEVNDRPQLTQQAITLSALTSLFSFGLLLMGDIPVAAAFGSIILFGNIVNLLLALLYSEQHHNVHLHSQ